MEFEKMERYLLIVESPTKARTLKKIVGDSYEIKASMGHVKDLPKSDLGVEIENGFDPHYELIKGKKKILLDIKKSAKKAEKIYLGTDPDREGEAIAWHISEEIGDGKDIYRVLFHEFTAKRVLEALRNPETLNRNRYESQVARRILDRLVGYLISPILWEKVRRGLSAGRVQSVALRIIVEREREIQSFVREEYWTVSVRLEGNYLPSFECRLVEKGGQKVSIRNQDEAERIVEELRGSRFFVSRVIKKEKKRFPSPPFITSKLQQEASRKLGFSPVKTMLIAQHLYEGVDLGEGGPVGLITYMRTDSVRVSAEALAALRRYISEQYGEEYLSAQPYNYRNSKTSQDAHEAIRPTSVEITPQMVKDYLDEDHYLLYDLIWKRFVTSQMTPAVYDQTIYEITAGDYLLRATGSIMRFKGFTALYTEGRDEVDAEEDDAISLPVLEEGEELRPLEFLPKQHFTQPPPRFTEATLVKELEEKGIGRPSTYAIILSTIQERGYVKLESGRFKPTELGFLVSDLLVTHFSDIINVEFTASMEEMLDKIEEGEMDWRSVLWSFYSPFRQSLEKAKMEMVNVKATGIPTDIICESCGSKMVIRWGKNGNFLACSSYPSCKNTKNFYRDVDGRVRIKNDEPVHDLICELCGSPMVIKNSRFGKFLSCSSYPKCLNKRPLDLGVGCPVKDCDGKIVERKTKRRKVFYSCSNYPRCTFAIWDRPISRSCPSCGFPLLVEKKGRGGVIYLCINKGCNFKERKRD